MLAWLAKIGIGSIADKLAEAYLARQRATTDLERLAAEERIEFLHAKKEILLAEVASGGPASWVRPLFAFPFILYIWKLVIWDKVFALGATDALSENLTEIMMLVIGSYFIGRSAEKIASTLRRKK